MKCYIHGDQLPAKLQAQVLRAYGYRWTSENLDRAKQWHGGSWPTTEPIPDAQWLREHSFALTKGGALDQRPGHAFPACFADEVEK